MRSLDRLGSQPVSLPLLADDIVEFHAARLMLLMHLCGVRGRINGLTKMAKLDFFVRYPDFFASAQASETNDAENPEIHSHDERVESAMVRHHYGPWDKRYYHILAHLEAKGLISISKSGKSYQIALTEFGAEKAKALGKLNSFSQLVVHMREVKRVFGGKSGSYLKNLIYRLFDEEVGKRPMGEKID